jgi:hypothetical protein
MKGGVRKGAGRPALPDKKTQINVKLPPWLISWMDGQEESRAVLIENSLRLVHKLKPPTAG